MALMPLLLVFATLLTADDPARVRSDMKDRDLETYGSHVSAFFSALEKDDRHGQAEALEKLGEAMDKAARKRKDDREPLEYLGDWDLVFELAKPIGREMKSNAGKGFVRGDFVDPWDERPIGYLMSLPPDYGKSDQLHPAILALKPPIGAGGDDMVASVTAMANAMYADLMKDTIVFIPLGPVEGSGRKATVGEVDGSWLSTDGLYALFTAFRTLLEQVRYDRARLVLDGWREAGGDALRLASRAPYWFAGVVVRSGAIPEDGDVVYENLQAVPAAYVRGSGDGARDLGRLENLALKVIEEPGSAVEPGEVASAEIAAWCRARSRPLVPIEIDHRIDSLAYQSAYWVKAAMINRRPTAKPGDADFPHIKARSDRARNAISIETTSVADGVWVYLSDAIVDLDKPVVIEVNGKERIKQEFKRDLRIALENRFYNNSGDCGVYTAQVFVEDID